MSSSICYAGGGFLYEHVRKRRVIKMNDRCWSSSTLDFYVLKNESQRNNYKEIHKMIIVIPLSRALLTWNTHTNQLVKTWNLCPYSPRWSTALFLMCQFILWNVLTVRTFEKIPPNPLKKYLSPAPSLCLSRIKESLCNDAGIYLMWNQHWAEWRLSHVILWSIGCSLSLSPVSLFHSHTLQHT